jgi:hypothetical protein
MKAISSGKSNLSRRDFIKLSALGAALVGMGGVVAYGISHEEELGSAKNMLRMGHCAPSIAQTLLEMNDIRSDRLVLYAGGLAGGIAGENTECGGISAPLMVLGIQNDPRSPSADPLALIHSGQRYTQEFIAYNGSCNCCDVGAGGITACLKVITAFHTPLSIALSAQGDLPREKSESYARFLEIFAENNFHCAHRVFEKLGDDIHDTDELLRASWLFVGGSAFQQLTCGALTAGAMALSAQNTDIEDSYPRVARMIWLMMNNDETAARKDINNFNNSIRLSEALGTWFRTEFGTTSCYQICGLDFSKEGAAERYLSNGCMQQCEMITEQVAQKVRAMITTERFSG